MAKNYLTEDEMKSMELIVSAYLDLAENRARRHIPMTMETGPSGWTSICRRMIWKF